MSKAITIYNDFIDLDNQDYTETRDTDILLVYNLLEEVGEETTRAFLTEYFYG